MIVFILVVFSLAFGFGEIFAVIVNVLETILPKLIKLQNKFTLYIIKLLKNDR